nr:hypothetical protein B0A51_10200 [Rachicladosporium sp. CCFEE 5018]
MAAAPGHHGGSGVGPDTLITVKISVNDNLRKLKLPLRDLGAGVLIDKLRTCLSIKPEQHVTFERFSDSAGGYIVLDATNPQVFKTLIRAAKAKLKLRLKATVAPEAVQEETPVAEDPKATPNTMEPVIVSSPAQTPSLRETTPANTKNIGSGIFEFREARASQQTLVDDEAPVPKPFTADRTDFFTALANASKSAAATSCELAFRNREPALNSSNTTTVHPMWSVYCNECDAAMQDAHYHCSICDSGDYDLCEGCIATGKLCPGEGHWLIKRFIKDGKVITSTTERIGRKPKQENEKVAGAIPVGHLKSDPHFEGPVRTCNNCIDTAPEDMFVTCQQCEDFDLCLKCHARGKHGHHPAHAFDRATEKTILSMTEESMLTPGRNIRHNAICDGCDKSIYGVRHKCLSCPDFDYCRECVQSAPHIHPQHRFAAIYTPIVDIAPNFIRHAGIYCDGPLCTTNSNFITGVRYKCAVCHDTDFCANCEALPSHHHNRTHPLIKFKTPVRNVSITTMNEDQRGNVRNMGDKRPEATTEATSALVAPATMPNKTTAVKTVGEIKPTLEKSQPIPIFTSAKSTLVPPPAAEVPAGLLNAVFVHDSVADGMVVQPGARFTQIWTMKNEGPFAWPAGCSVRYVGGDNMLNVDNTHPASVSDINTATESNVVGREVMIGEEIAFKVTLKAPMREGKAISYWRVKAADGTPFGHRLWCDVEVEKSADAVSTTPIEQPTVSLPARPFVANQQDTIRNAMQAQMTQRQQMLEHLGTPQSNPTGYAAIREALHRQREAREQGSPAGSSIASAASSPARTTAEKEHARMRVEALKAKILKARAEKQACRAEFVESRKSFTPVSPSAEASKSAQTTEKVQKIIEQASKIPVEEEKTEELATSQMVFPRLEKESPSSSMVSSSTKGKAAYVENEAGEVESSAVPAPAAHSTTPAEEGFDDLTDEIEVLSASGMESDDGFLTDEEYDILDASDHETPLAFLTYALKYLPYAISAPYSVIYIPTRSTHKLRALVFTPKAFTKGIERTGLRPLHIDFHGGSFLGGIAEYGVPFCKEVCDRTGAVVISAQYRHAPANVYPAAHEDAEDVVDWVLANAEKRFGADAKDLTISGWSAGGNLMMVAGKRAKAAVGICAAIDLRSPPDAKPKPASFLKSDPSAWLLPLFDAYAMPA